jgi:ribosomal protein S6--L-glutamate ligase
VNASPGLEGIEAATGVNVSEHIIKHLERHAGKGAKREKENGDRSSK